MGTYPAQHGIFWLIYGQGIVIHVLEYKVRKTERFAGTMSLSICNVILRGKRMFDV